jgi:hypothetical protein
MQIPPWVFAALVLLGVCVIGVMIVNRKHEGVPEGYVGAPPPTASPPAGALPQAAATNANTQAQVAQLLQALQTRIPQLPPANPAAAQATPTGAVPAVLTDGSGSQYVPNITRILPHQQLPGQLPSLIAAAPPDAAMSQQIQDASGNLLPSVRQMIRDEVKKELPEVISDYEIKYTTAPTSA